MTAYSHNANSLMPLMTANNAPSPVVITASSEYQSLASAFQMFDQNTGTYWRSDWVQTGWIKIYTGGALWTVSSYTVLGSANQASADSPKAWTLYGSTDNISWVALDVVTGQTGWDSNNDMRTFAIDAPAAYSYYKFDVTESDGAHGCLGCSELELIGGQVFSRKIPLVMKDGAITELPVTESLNIGPGQTYNINNTPHTHAVFKLDDAAAPDDNTDLNASTTAHGLLLKATAPASGLRNVVGIDNAETAYTNKALFDATALTAEAFGSTSSVGTAMTAARRDHRHAMAALPAIDATGAATDIATRNATTTAHGLVVKAVAPAAGLTNVLAIENTETVYKMKALFDVTDPSTQAFGDAAAVGSAVVSARRDHKHAMPASPIAASISDGDTTHAPDGNSVFDALALKAPLASPTFTVTAKLSNTASGTVGPVLTLENASDQAASTAAKINFYGDGELAKISFIRMVQATGATDIAFSTYKASVGLTEHVRVTDQGYFGVRTITPTRTLDVNGVIGIFDADTKNYNAGIVTEAYAAIINIGLNDSSTNRFGGSYTAAKQGGFLRISQGDYETPLFSFKGRVAGNTSDVVTLIQILSTGYLGVGMAPTVQFELSGAVGQKSSGTTWANPSDARLKNIAGNADLDRCWEIVKGVPLKRYELKKEAFSDEQISDRNKLGWIADDVEAFFPKSTPKSTFSLVPIPDGEEEYEEKDPKTGDAIKKTRPKFKSDVIENCRSLDADQLFAAMYGVVQKLMTISEDQQAVIKDLQAKVKVLESKGGKSA